MISQVAVVSSPSQHDSPPLLLFLVRWLQQCHTVPEQQRLPIQIRSSCRPISVSMFRYNGQSWKDVPFLAAISRLGVSHTCHSGHTTSSCLRYLPWRVRSNSASHPEQDGQTDICRTHPDQFFGLVVETCWLMPWTFVIRQYASL